MSALAYNVQNAAKALDVSPRTIWRLIEAGELPTFKLGTRTLIRYAAITEMIDRHSQAA